MRALAILTLLMAGCSTVRPWQRGRLAGPTLQFQLDPYAAAQEHSILEITERGSFAGAGPGSAGGGCGCH
jgi:hypothetical protein